MNSKVYAKGGRYSSKKKFKYSFSKIGSLEFY